MIAMAANTGNQVVSDVPCEGLCRVGSRGSIGLIGLLAFDHYVENIKVLLHMVQRSINASAMFGIHTKTAHNMENT